MFGYVYITTNKLTGQRYIGKKESDQYDPHYLGSGIIITRAIKKYGREQFTNQLLEWAETKELLNELKKKHIAEHKKIGDLYNLTEGGDGGDTISANPRKKEIIAQRRSTSIQRYGIDNYNQHPDVKVQLGKRIANGWQRKFSSLGFDRAAYSDMCSKRNKAMWAGRGVTLSEKVERSLRQQRYLATSGAKERLSKSVKYSWLRKSVTYEVTFPDGHQERVKCLRGWCADHGLPYYTLYNSLRNNRPSKDGWLLRIV